MEFVTSRDALRSFYREPGDNAVRKEMRSLDHHAKGFLKRSPFVLIGSSDGQRSQECRDNGDRSHCRTP